MVKAALPLRRSVSRLRRSMTTARVFTSPDSANVAENTTTVMTVTATDADVPSQTVTFSIAGGADQTKFAITSGGALLSSCAEL